LSTFAATTNGHISRNQRAAAQAQGQSEAEDWLTYEQVTALALSGHLKQARMIASRAVDFPGWNQKTGSKPISRYRSGPEERIIDLFSSSGTKALGAVNRLK
jgi:hypothetical protein